MNRVVFLVDMNAFYISCEMTRNPHLAGKPAAVAGDPKKRTGIILTANYEARKKGVKTAMTLYKALELCPGMMLVPPDHGFYEQKSREVMDILCGYTPVVEKNSIDEAWMDMTGCEMLFGEPLESAKAIMENIKNDLGLWCSIGISENKFLSKMASEMKKPLGITQLWKKDIQSLLWPLSIRSMYGVGRQTATKLNGIGIETIGDLAVFDRGYLSSKLGRNAAALQELANGIDPSSVVVRDPKDMKSIGRSVTLPEDVSDFVTAKAILLELSEGVGTSARCHGKKGQTVQITVKYTDFSVITRQIRVGPTNLTKEIYNAGLGLLYKNWKPKRPVRLLGISLSGFSEEPGVVQLSIFDLQESGSRNLKEEKLEKAVDAIRSRHGASKIKRAVLLERQSKKGPRA